jgi:predicted nucleic acid-binding protein
LLVTQAVTPEARRLYGRDREMLVWWAAGLECVSAVARLERDGVLRPRTAGSALAYLDALVSAWREVEPTEPVRRTARRLLLTHHLRAGDALQLAAAIVGADDDPSTLEFVTLDGRLNAAARREGFPVTDFAAG